MIRFLSFELPDLSHHKLFITVRGSTTGRGSQLTYTQRQPLNTSQKSPLLLLLLLSLLLLSAAPVPRAHFQGTDGPQGRAYLPLLLGPQSAQTGGPPGEQPLIHLPYFTERPVYHQAAVFWFGRVKGAENYADVRIGYTDEVIFLRLTIIDRHLWYDTSPTPAEMEAWDAAAVYLHLGDRSGGRLQERSYRFVAQLDGWEGRTGYEAVYQGSASGWHTLPFRGFSRSGWRGNAPNNNTREDRGHLLTFEIPFSELGLFSGPPQNGERWKLALSVYDRDDAAGAERGQKHWPAAFSDSNPDTWGEISFGMPAYQAPVLPVDQVVALRHGVDGVTIRDGSVGGSTNCGGRVDFWNQWGDTSYPGAEHLNVQNQSDVSDFPCFSKLYITIPLDSLPRGRVILSASLTLRQSGNATSHDSGEALNSLIQAGVVAQNWDEATLSWNNAPPLVENISQTWVTPVTSWPGWPGIPWTWDVSLAAARAYASGQPLRLVLYSADNFGPNGKYFYSSDAGMAGRPTLQVELGKP